MNAIRKMKKQTKTETRSTRFKTRAGVVLLAAIGLIPLISPTAAIAGPQSEAPTAELLVKGLAGGSGSTVGPDGALYVTEGLEGRISRVDTRTGKVSTFATGLPKSIIGIGGAIDVAFIGHTAYALVTLVSPEVGGSDTNGIYRVDGPDRFTVVADIGEFAELNPPAIPFDYILPQGLQYAIQTYRGGFLVTDAHLNRVYQVKRRGEISVFIDFGNVAPTGLEVFGNVVFMAETGPVPNLPEDGKVVAFGPRSSAAVDFASGAPNLVDVEFGPALKQVGRRHAHFGRSRALYVLSNGDYAGDPPGSPALPNTGALLKVNGDGTLTEIMVGLNLPTSLEFIGNKAYVITLIGEIWEIAGFSGPPFGRWH